MTDTFDETTGLDGCCWQVVVTNGGGQIKIRQHEKDAVLSVPVIMPARAAVGVYEALGRAIQAASGK